MGKVAPEILFHLLIVPHDYYQVQHQHHESRCVGQC
jgi:hypothetical protein